MFSVKLLISLIISCVISRIMYRVISRIMYRIMYRVISRIMYCVINRIMYCLINRIMKHTFRVIQVLHHPVGGLFRNSDRLAVHYPAYYPASGSQDSRVMHSVAALQALSIRHPLLKTCTLPQASKQSQAKAGRRAGNTPLCAGSGRTAMLSTITWCMLVVESGLAFQRLQLFRDALMGILLTHLIIFFTVMSRRPHGSNITCV